MAERPGVGLLVPNLFLRVPLDSAVRGLGAEPVGLAGREAVERGGCKVVVVDLDVLKPEPGPAIKSWVRAGIVVLGFGPHVEAALLAAARQAGAVVLPRSAFLGRLPELLAAAMATAGLATTPPGNEGGDADDHGP
jgi:hypothetical protein